MNEFEKLKVAKEQCESILPKAWESARLATPKNTEGHTIIPSNDEWRNEPDWE